MKIGVAVRRWSGRGGLERNVFGLVRFLVARGHAVHVVAQRIEVEAPGVTVHPVKMFGWWPERLKIGRFSAAAMAALEGLGCDVTFTSGHVAGPKVVRLEMGLSTEYMRARPELAQDPVERAVAANEAQKLAAARRVLALSEGTAQTLRAELKIPNERIRVIRNGLDLQHFPKVAPPRNGTPVVAFIGSGFARKGLGPLIEGLAKGPKVRLVVAGEDRTAPDYAALARAEGVDLQLVGFQPDVRPVLAAADVVALPSLYDPYGLTVLEALATGRPVITTRQAGAHEITPFPELVVDRAEPAALAEVVNRALTLAAHAGTADRARAAAEEWPLQRGYAEIEGVLTEA